MILPHEATDSERKIILPFSIILSGIVFDILTTEIALRLGFQEGNINYNPTMEFISVMFIMSIAMIIYQRTKSEFLYNGLVVISFITFIPPIYNIMIMLFSSL